MSSDEIHVPLEELQAQVTAYREHVRVLEDRLCDLQLELARQQRIERTLRQSLDYHLDQAVDLQARQESLAALVQRLTTELADAGGECGRLGAALNHAEAEIEAVRSSWSWRLTAPVRAAARLLRFRR